jgi:prepilin peptidase CpaA
MFLDLCRALDVSCITQSVMLPSLSLALTPLLSAIVLTAAAMDIWQQRIPNWLTLTSMAIALGLHTFKAGEAGFVFSLGGIALGIALLLAFYWLGGMGAGDVKLLGAVGGFLGPSGVLAAFTFTAVLGAGYALVLYFNHWGLRTGIHRIATRLVTFVLTGHPGPPSPADAALPKLRYGAVIALGTVITQWLILHEA